MKPVPQSSLYESLARVLPQSGPNLAPPKSSGKTEHGKRLILPDDRKVRVLVAEDNPLNQKLAKLQLKRLGLEVDTVANGREAVEALASIPYDVVLMDCQMPEMDGYEATRAIWRREGSERHTWIIAMTAHALAGDRDKCLAAGMDAYISKPVRPEVLVATLAEAIAMGSAAMPAPAAAHIPAAVNGVASHPPAEPPVIGNPINVDPTNGNPADGNPTNGDSKEAAHSTGNGAAVNPLQAGHPLKAVHPSKESLPPPSATPPFDPKVVADLRADGVLGELIELFLSDTPISIEKIGAALTLKDPRTAAREAHRLKGSAAALGAQPMFELCELLQRLDSAEGLETAQALFALLSAESKRVCQAFEAERAADLLAPPPG
ncbi:MAG TPA: response regulator [Candidatus Binataceae bacterium]|nr:response regulator [Candidatus Binataceae bacterium]